MADHQVAALAWVAYAITAALLVCLPLSFALSELRQADGLHLPHTQETDHP